MLHIEGLSISIENRKLVSDFSCALSENEVTCLIGPSGCGKTSVLKWLAGILSPTLGATGALTLDDTGITPPHASTTYQPQSDALFPWLTIAQNAALGLEVAGIPTKTARADVLMHFKTFGLAGCENLYPEQISGGMRQRAAFLRTLVQNSRFILLDEPFSALDAVTRLRMQAWLCDQLAHTPRGVLMVTHDLHEATQIADRILVMPAAGGPLAANISVTTPRHARTETAMAQIRTTLKSLLLES
ncbi:NitT/TauT family transport system ATP-binding protein [Sulfitobacter undariae]|uniref:NitT/TauT family transport system ATP-binding protein n=1 Tax=Sulfitobacter undariae TaxID=1563671 RepID=A0A7W6E6J6_9RHOB|nr:ABC transporter ATP-binding protein [Sulfitobacter undariae]MBB3995677.1 NitT/TauT family transport system ATP-binding protein [Sulfitobacter undariae]